jgi:acetylornithine/succinyldiaminopimelate/putrescine aminotransferase
MIRAFFPPSVLPQDFSVNRGENDVLFASDGKRYIDLLSGSGTAFLGHANPAIVSALKQQLDLLWNTGVIPTSLGAQVRAAIEEHFPRTHGLAVLYSTGMEAAEFAIRVARQATGRKAIVGFDGSMHGKSMAAARLGWPNELVTLPDFHRLPYLPQLTEEVILTQVEAVVASSPVAGVFLEPLLGSRGGHIPSRRFVEQLATLCQGCGTLLVMDEIFTGFGRTGTPFLYTEMGVTPDIVLIGKAVGNGFPVSGVVVNRRYSISPAMLPGSTFAGNPMAAAVVLATLQEMARIDVPARVSRIEQIVRSVLEDPLAGVGVALRGKGALWVLELPPSMRVAAVMGEILASGVIVSPTANYIRLLPAATITPAHLTEACAVIRDVCLAHAGSGQ